MNVYQTMNEYVAFCSMLSCFLQDRIVCVRHVYRIKLVDNAYKCC